MTEHTGTELNPFQGLSEAMANAVDLSARSTLTVDARKRMPASGVAYTEDLVLTADHVVEREEDLHVYLPDGSKAGVTLAGRDPGTDLALLRLEKPLLSPSQPAQAEARIGQLVLALGRPSLDGVQASLGVVSAFGGPVRTGRGGMLERYIRADTTPYPGFSGGPLVDAAGRLVGINTSGLSGGELLAIPVSLAWSIAQNLAQHGHMRRAYLGIRSQPVGLPASQQQVLGRQQKVGLLLVGVEEGGPAEQGGLMVGDILVGLAGQPIGDPDDLLARLAGAGVDQSIPVEILRGGQALTIAVKVGVRN
jgi:S1-C subfamily serine protease